MLWWNACRLRDGQQDCWQDALLCLCGVQGGPSLKATGSMAEWWTWLQQSGKVPTFLLFQSLCLPVSK